MDIPEITNNVIAGLICSAIVSIITLLMKFLKRKYIENKELLFLRIRFITALIGIICIFHTNVESSIFPLWLKSLCFIINICGAFYSFEDAINYKK